MLALFNYNFFFVQNLVSQIVQVVSNLLSYESVSTNVRRVIVFRLSNFISQLLECCVKLFYLVPCTTAIIRFLE